MYAKHEPAIFELLTDTHRRTLIDAYGPTGVNAFGEGCVHELETAFDSARAMSDDPDAAERYIHNQVRSIVARAERKLGRNS